MFRKHFQLRASTMITLCVAFAFFANTVDGLTYLAGNTVDGLTNSSNATATPHGHHGHELDMPFLIILWVIMLVQCVVYAVLHCIPKECYTPPFTLVMAVMGAACCLFGIYYVDDSFWENEWAAEVLKSLKVWANVKADAMLFVLLPPLLFDAAFNIDFHTFTKILPTAMTLALPGVLLAVTMTAGCIHVINTNLVTWIPDWEAPEGWEWNWPTSFLTASILCATDPVAVVAILHTLGAPAKLATLIEGESLLNDGSAMVLFLILRDMVHAGGADSVTPTMWLVRFLRLAVLGSALGWVSAILTCIFLRAIENPVVEVSMIASVVFASFFVAEHYCGASGVLCVVVYGIYMSRHKHSILSPRGQRANKVVWATVSFFANSCIFVLSGVIIARMMVELLHMPIHRLSLEPATTSLEPLVTTMFNATTPATPAPGLDIFKYGDLWAYTATAFSLYVMLHVIRAIVVFFFWGIGLRHCGYGITFKEAVMITYSGLRGAVGLALAMIVETDAMNGYINNYVADLIGFQVGTVAVLTLVINGATAGTLYNWLNIYRVSEFLDVLRNHALSEVRQAGVRYAEKMRDTSSFEAGADWELIWKLVPDWKLIHFKHGHLVTPRNDGVVSALIKARNHCSCYSNLRSKIKSEIKSKKNHAVSPGKSDSDVSDGEIQDLQRRETRGEIQITRMQSNFNFAGMHDEDEDARARDNESRNRSVHTLQRTLTDQRAQDASKSAEIKRATTPRELRKVERLRSGKHIDHEQSHVLNANNFVKFAQVHPDEEFTAEEKEMCAFDMQHQMYMMLLMSMKRYYQRDYEEKGTLNSRGLLYLNDAVDRARDELVKAADKVFKDRLEHLHVSEKGIMRPRASSLFENKKRRVTFTPSKPGEEMGDDGKEHLEPLMVFWKRLCTVLKLCEIDRYAGSCHYGMFANVQCAIQALHSVIAASNKIIYFLSESLIPMNVNSEQTKIRLATIQKQLHRITGEARDFLLQLEEDYENDVCVTKSIMVARQIIRRCDKEVKQLYSHGMFDCHLKAELDEYLLQRETTLVHYGDVFVMLRPC